MKSKVLGVGSGPGFFLLLVFVFWMVHPLGAGAKAGAQLKIATKDGTIVHGELLAVKGRALLVDGGNYATGAAIELDDIRDLAVVGKSKGLLVSGIGLLGGAAVGALIGSTAPRGGWWGDPPNFNGVSFVAIGAGVGAAAGAAFGFLVGTLMRQDEPLIVASVYQVEPGELLTKLRSAAKDPEYR